MAVPSKISGFHWLLDRFVHRDDLCLRLMTPELKNAATVFLVPDAMGLYVWHVWDRSGVGGENSAERTLEKAIGEAERATVRWGKHSDMICNCGSDLDGSHDHTTCGPPVPRNG